MDPLKHELLLRQLADFGYPLIAPAETDAKRVLLHTLEADDIRILEGFPIVMVNLLTRKLLTLDELENTYQTIFDLTLKKRFLLLCGVTYHLIAYLEEQKEERKLLSRFIASHDTTLLSRLHKQFLDRSTINLGGIQLDIARLENSFRNYVLTALAQRKQSVEESLQEKRARALNEALSTLFSQRQRQIIFKLLSEQKLDKTEREYYSRVIKKRLRALANSEMQTIAETLLAS